MTTQQLKKNTLPTACEAVRIKRKPSYCHSYENKGTFKRASLQGSTEHYVRQKGQCLSFDNMLHGDASGFTSRRASVISVTLEAERHTYFDQYDGLCGRR